PILVRDLLHHTAGLPDYSAVWRGAVEDACLANAHYLPLLFQHPLVFPTGTRAEYSNSNYVVLAALVERISGRPFGSFLRREVLAPLGMDGSFVHDRPGLAIPNRARGYNVNEQGEIEVSDLPIILVGHSHLFATALDLVRWERALRTGQLVGAETLARAFTPGRLDSGERHEYGFGWYDDSANGRPSVGHSGSWYGFRNYFCYFLRDELTVVVLSNNESLPAGQLVDQVAAAHFNSG